MTRKKQHISCVFSGESVHTEWIVWCDVLTQIKRSDVTPYVSIEHIHKNLSNI